MVCDKMNCRQPYKYNKGQPGILKIISKHMTDLWQGQTQEGGGVTSPLVDLGV